MTFKSQMETDLDVFFDEEHFAESVTYNGEEILAVVDYGEDLDEVTGNETNRVADTVMIKASDVAAPAYRDTVVIGDYTYTVLRRKSGDGDMWTLELSRDERPVI